MKNDRLRGQFGGFRCKGRSIQQYYNAWFLIIGKHRSFNLLVAGSIPAPFTNFSYEVWAFLATGPVFRFRSFVIDFPSRTLQTTIQLI